MHPIDLTLLALYLGGVLLIGYRAARRSRTTDAYIVAGRSLPAWVLAGSLTATLVGAGMTLGAAGAAYEGRASVLWLYLGYACGLLVMSIVGPKMRATRATSVGTLFGARFGRAAQVAAGGVAFFYTLVLVGYSIAGVSRVCSYVAAANGLEVDLTLLTVVITAALALYTFAGGLFAVAWTDFVQVVLMVAGIAIIGPWVGLIGTGGPESAAARLADEGIDVWSPLASVGFAAAATNFVLLFVSNVDPTSFQRALAGRGARQVRDGFLIAAVVAIVSGAGLLVTAGTGRLLLPTLVDDYGTPEALLPVFFLKLFPVGLSGVGMAALLAALMSTIDSFLLVVSVCFFHDVLRPLAPRLVPARLERRLLGAGVLAFALLSLIVALRVSRVFDAMIFVFSLLGAAIAIPLIATLWWRRVTTPGIVAGIVAPALYVVACSAIGWKGPGGDPIYLGMLLSLVAIPVVSRATRARGGYASLSDSGGDSGLAVGRRETGERRDA